MHGLQQVNTSHVQRNVQYLNKPTMLISDAKFVGGRQQAWLFKIHQGYKMFAEVDRRQRMPIKSSVTDEKLSYLEKAAGRKDRRGQLTSRIKWGWKLTVIVLRWFLQPSKWAKSVCRFLKERNGDEDHSEPLVKCTSREYFTKSGGHGELHIIRWTEYQCLCEMVENVFYSFYLGAKSLADAVKLI